MKALRIILPLLLCAVASRGLGDSGATFIGMDGGIQPRISPDGNHMAVSYQGAIVVTERGLFGHKVMFMTKEEGFDIQPAWSRDGKRLAYINTQNFRQGQLRLVTMPEGKPVKLPVAVRAQGRLYFHPDGKRLLGRFSKAGFPNALAWLDLKSGALKPVAIEGIDKAKLNTWRLAYALSFDGKRIALATNLDVRGEQGGNNGPMNDLWLVPSAGGKAKKVVRFPARIYEMEWEPNPNGDDSLYWQAVYVVTDLGTAHNDIWRVPFREPLRRMKKLTQGQGDEGAPTADAKRDWVHFTDNSRKASGFGKLYAKPVGDFEQTDGLPISSIRTGCVLRLIIKDADTDKGVSTRVSVKRKGGKFHAPIGAEYRVNGGRMHFYSNGFSDVTVVPGEYEIIATRGPEFGAIRVTKFARVGTINEVTVKLKRWTNQAKRGWYSGENHIHANYGYGEWHVTPMEMLLMAKGEGLNVSNIMVANSDGDGVFDRRYFRGRPDRQSTKDTILYWNQEYRSTIWGHMTFIGLEQLVEPIFTGFKNTTNPFDVPTNADSAAAAKIRQGVVSYTHPAGNRADPYNGAYSAKGLPVDAALGRIDTLDVMGFGYDASVPLWYRLLNCGFRMGAAAGTDCFLNRIVSWPPGWGRAYVHCPGGFNYAAWAAGQKAGRSFVTTGPMLELTVDGKGIGSTLQLKQPGQVKVRAKATSQFPMAKVELVVNGEVVKTLKLAGDKLSAELNGVLELKTSGWLALRASGPSSQLLAPRGLRAHTSPVYVDIPSQVPDAGADAEFFLKWIDRLEDDLRKRDRIPGGIDRHVKIQIDQARAWYRALSQKRP